MEPGCATQNVAVDGCFCARNAHLFGRDSYWRNSRTKLTSYTRASYITRGVTAIKSFTKNREDRGVGRVPSSCNDPNKPDLHVGLCYQRCQDGYKGGLTRCYRECLSGYTDCGTYCVPSGVPLSCAAFFGAIYQGCGAKSSRIAGSGQLASDGGVIVPEEMQRKLAAYIAALLAGNMTSVSDFIPVQQAAWGAAMQLSGTVPGCTTSLECFCRGVRSGLSFENPFEGGTFITCYSGAAVVQQCSHGMVFDAKVGMCSTSEEAEVDVCKHVGTGVYPLRLPSGEYEVGADAHYDGKPQH
ncbi:hypothetical protein OEZ85_012757 [Tetradesmus obliquus]|uniref:Chitin-binding type-2 domain-containing protein n=1 Tax=Tetradesmus obliquus TaxID=3088 RepID=A0ABY8U497_TETOB|nr:hypothetical protein OEZ85_012757 [Tetradesmus obliquus]